MNDQQENMNNAPEFVIQRIYVKDLSYEAPNVPEIFREEWKPQTELALDNNFKQLSDDTYEVALKLTVTVKLKDKTAFLVEAEEAGIFTLKGFIGDQLEAMLESFCPNILFPYLREVISDAVNRGSFPPLYLTPINFDAIYKQKLDKKKDQGN